MEKFMRLALKQAERAKDIDEVPIGAVIVQGDKIIAKAHNSRNKTQNAINHAEILAISKACKQLKSWRLDDCDIYVTLEPCPMCAGAILNARIKNLYFGAYDKKTGACSSVFCLSDDVRHNHHLNVQGGFLEKECADLLSSFFKRRRLEKKIEKRATE